MPKPPGRRGTGSSMIQGWRKRRRTRPLLIQKIKFASDMTLRWSKGDSNPRSPVEDSIIGDGPVRAFRHCSFLVLYEGNRGCSDHQYSVQQFEFRQRGTWALPAPCLREDQPAREPKGKTLPGWALRCSGARTVFALGADHLLDSRSLSGRKRPSRGRHPPVRTGSQHTLRWRRESRANSSPKMGFSGAWGISAPFRGAYG
jgi:hypothetical protein